MAKKDQEKLLGNPVARAIPVPADGVRMETFIPWTLVKRRVNRQVITPLDAPQKFREEATREKQVRESLQDTALIRDLGLPHHWQRLLDLGEFATIAEIANAEGVECNTGAARYAASPFGPGGCGKVADAVLEKVMRRNWPNQWGDQNKLVATVVGTGYSAHY